jgi:ectoine hydroxylase-related dioxygenase (phytanoyl-CoA dioxygenase family)
MQPITGPWTNVTTNGKRWRWDACELPWFDRPDAVGLLEHRRKSDRLIDLEFELLQCWLANGYCIVDDLVDESLIDGMERDLDDLWNAARPQEGLELLGLRVESDGEPRNLTHAELLRLDGRTRQEVRAQSNWRVHGFHRFFASAAAIFRNPGLARMASLILGRPAAPSYSINFTHGSEQELHQDTAVFHIVPPNYLVGAWVACEDILPGSGPLVIYPGSHRGPMYPQFDCYPQTNLRTSRDPDAYAEFVRELSQRYEPMVFHARKGETLFWHGMLIHGGTPVTDRRLSRRSYVCHYIPPGMDVASKIEGPFNW